jgi:hypothetical protein
MTPWITRLASAAGSFAIAGTAMADPSATSRRLVVQLSIKAKDRSNQQRGAKAKSDVKPAEHRHPGQSGCALIVCTRGGMSSSGVWPDRRARVGKRRVGAERRSSPFDLSPSKKARHHGSDCKIDDETAHRKPPSVPAETKRHEHRPLHLAFMPPVRGQSPSIESGPKERYPLRVVLAGDRRSAEHGRGDRRLRRHLVCHTRVQMALGDHHHGISDTAIEALKCDKAEGEPTK